MTATKVVEARVARGAKLLDEKRPGWWRTITLKDLDLQDPNQCALGQTFKHSRAVLVNGRTRDLSDHEGYWKGLLHLFGPSAYDIEGLGYSRFWSARYRLTKKAQRLVVTYGFDIAGYNDGINGTFHEAYERLRLAWAEEIRERRHAAYLRSARGRGSARA